MKGICTALFVLFGLAQWVFADDVIHYTLVVTQEYISPACSPRLTLVINGTLPGPEIHANGGDHVHIRYVFAKHALREGYGIMLRTRILQCIGMVFVCPRASHSNVSAIWFSVQRRSRCRNSMANSTREIL